MSFRVYKCNAKDLPHQVAVGDWDYVFERKSTDWGSTGLKNVDKVSAGDVLFALNVDWHFSASPLAHVSTSPLPRMKLTM